MSSKNYFREVAEKWDEMRSDFFSEALRDKAIARAGAAQNETAADIGAGTGFMTEGLIKRGCKVIAVDQSVEMLGVLRKKFGDGGLVDGRLGEAERLPVGDGEVDYVFANMYLHHVDDPAATIAEMARIIRPGGKLVLTDLDSHSHAFLLSEHHDRWPGFVRSDVHRWLVDAGLKNVEVGSASEQCCAQSCCGDETASISIFLASGLK